MKTDSQHDYIHFWKREYFLILLDVTLREQNIHVNNVFCNWHSRRFFLQDLSLLNLASRISF